MTQESYRHPITPPPELVQQWIDTNRTWLRGIALEAAQWGADQELEACIDWISVYHGLEHPELLIELLHAARRPKPPSLKEQALLAIDTAVADDRLSADVADVVRRALEQLPDNE